MVAIIVIVIVILLLCWEVFAMLLRVFLPPKLSIPVVSFSLLSSAVDMLTVSAGGHGSLHGGSGPPLCVADTSPYLSLHYQYDMYDFVTVT